MDATGIWNQPFPARFRSARIWTKLKHPTMSSAVTRRCIPEFIRLLSVRKKTFFFQTIIAGHRAKCTGNWKQWCYQDFFPESEGPNCLGAEGALYQKKKNGKLISFGPLFIGRCEILPDYKKQGIFMHGRVYVRPEKNLFGPEKGPSQKFKGQAREKVLRSIPGLKESFSCMLKPNSGLREPVQANQAPEG